MERIAFVSDFFLEDMPFGGAEKCNDTIIKLLELKIDKIKASELNSDIISVYDFIILSNHIQLNKECKNELIKRKNYIIIEHDFGFLFTRDASIYEDYIAPKSHIYDFELYKNAKNVFLQSDRHHEVVYSNLGLDNLVSCKANPYLQEDLEMVLSNYSNDKIDKFAILDNPLWQKNTKGAIKFCVDNEKKYDILKRQDYNLFIAELSKYKSLVFLPLVFETFSRVCCEAALLGLSIYSNNNVSFTQSSFKTLKATELSTFLIENTQETISKIYESIRN